MGAKEHEGISGRKVSTKGEVKRKILTQPHASVKSVISGSSVKSAKISGRDEVGSEFISCCRFRQCVFGPVDSLAGYNYIKRTILS